MDFILQYKKTIYDRMNGWNKWQKRKVALMGLERQLKSYCRLSEHHSWSRQAEYIKLFDIFWNVILECKLLKEDIWEYHETIRPENITTLEDNTIDFAFSGIFSGNVEEFLNTLLEDTDAEETYLLLYLDYIICWLNEIEENESYEVEKYCSNRLIQKEIISQSIDMTTTFHINTFEEASKWRMSAKDVLIYQD